MLNRFIQNHVLIPSLALLTVLFACAVKPASATFPLVVASSQNRVATGMTAPTKVVIDGSGNLYTVSANGNLWEIPVGSTTAHQIALVNMGAYPTVTVGTVSYHTTQISLIVINNTGSGYTTAPAVTISAPDSVPNALVNNGVAVQATATANLSNGTVASITLNAGYGYTVPPTITIAPPPAGGIPAQLTGYVNSYYGLGGPHGLAVDSYGDVIAQASYNGHVFFLQNKSGVLCSTCNATGTGPLDLTGAYGFSGLDDYFGATSDVAVDANGLVYMAMTSCNSNGSNACGLSHNSIFTVQTSGPSTTAATIAAANTSQLFIGALPSSAGVAAGSYGAYAQNIALDTTGHFYYADGTYVWATPVKSPAPVKIGTFVKPYGVTVDPAGNLYVSDYGPKLLYCIPNEGGTLNPAHQYIVALATNLEYGVAFDASGNFYSGDGYTSGSINKTTLGALNLGSTPVGTASAGGTVNFWFNGPTTPSTISVIQGGSASTEFTLTGAGCTAGATYPTAATPSVLTCAETLTLTPGSTGIRNGAVTLLSATNKVLGTAYLTGIGTGPALTVDPGTQTAPSALSAWGTPSAVALDAAGNSYVADSTANAVQVISASGTATATLSAGLGLSGPRGVAVDGAGNVYISDTGNNQIVIVPNEGGTLNSADAVKINTGTGMPGPEGIAVDSFGAIYIADTGNKRVLRFSTFDGLSSPIQSSIGTAYVAATSSTPTVLGILQPTSVTTDNAGNVYVADASSSTEAVFEINLLSGVQQTILKNLSQPMSIAIDASGALYVVNAQSQSVSRVQITSNGLNPNSPLILGTNLSNPTGVAVNGAGTVAISDSIAPGVFLLNRNAGTLNFGNINLGLSSPASSVTLTDAGTAAVTLGPVPYVASGTGVVDYSVTSPSSGGCTGSQVLSIGAVCSYTAILSPVVGSGTLTELMSFSSNAVNAGTISELLTGVATNLSLTTTTLSLVSSSTPIYGQPVTVQASVVSQRAGYIPTGIVAFTLNGLPVAKNKITLTTTSPYTATFSFTALSLQAGINSVNASYLGDTNNAGSNATSPLFITVSKQTTANAVNVSTSPAVTGTQLTTSPGTTPYYFNVLISPSIVGSPTGTVNLVLAGTTTPVLATATLVSGAAQIVYTPPATSPSGNYNYQVIYAGDSNFSGSTGAGATVTFSPPSYSVSIPMGSYTVVAGQSVVVPVTITGLSGYASSVTVGALDTLGKTTTPGCMGLPANSYCNYSPGIVQLTPANSPGVLVTSCSNGVCTTAVGTYPVNNPAYVLSVTLSTSQAPATPYPVPAGFLLWPGGLAALLALRAATRKRGGLMRARLMGFAVAAALSGAMLGLTSCAATTLSSQYPTPLGTSAVTLTFSGIPAGGYPTDPVTNLPITKPNIIESLNFQLNVVAAQAQ